MVLVIILFFVDNSKYEPLKITDLIVSREILSLHYFVIFMKSYSRLFSILSDNFTDF